MVNLIFNRTVYLFYGIFNAYKKYVKGSQAKRIFNYYISDILVTWQIKNSNIH